MNHAILLISCPDRKGITATVTNFIYQHGGNILHSDQHIDEQTNTFFMRVEWSLKGFDIPGERIEGKLAKFYEDACLLEQPFIKDPSMKVKDILTSMVAKIGENIIIRRFVRFQTGEEL